MKILTTLTYYRPHYSGLTIYAERLAQALVQRGHAVTVLTSQFERGLPLSEDCQGVKVERLPVLLRISKGVIMPGMLLRAFRLARQADLVHLHVPQLDAALVAVISRLLGKPVVLTYHCDLVLPRGFIHRLANLASHLANHVAAQAAHVIVTNTQDYAEHSKFLRSYLSKVKPIVPPVELAPVSQADIAAFRKKAGIQPGQRIIGMAARLASEKGVEYLVQAMPEILKSYPQARVLFVGPYENLLGEAQYAQKLAPLIERLGAHWTFLGVVSPEELTAFFKEAEVTVLPSLNSTESFGMVQVESMTCGTPVVASDLPGVRVPVQMTGMGRVIPVADTQALAQALLDILDNPPAFSRNGTDVSQRFAPDTIAQEYEAIFRTLVRSARGEDVHGS